MDLLGKKAKEELEAIVATQEISLKRVAAERDKFKKRCTELEDAFKTEHGIEVRQEVTKIKADYNKMEMVIIMAAVEGLVMKGGAHPNDVKMYLALYEKIQSFVNKMDEKEEAKTE